jgi:hypothetical protein
MELVKGAQKRLLLALVVGLIACLCFASTASAAVGFGTPTPGENASISGPVDISLKVADAASDVAGPPNVMVMGPSGLVAVSPTWSPDGVLLMNGLALADGDYIVMVSLMTPGFAFHSKMWSFSVVPGGTVGPDPIVFSGGYPTGPIFNLKPEVGIGFSGPVPTAVSIFINGIEKAAVVDGDFIKLASGSIELEVGKYVAYAVADGATSAAWTFSVKAEYAGLDCFETCHTDIMATHTFVDKSDAAKSGCEPCHGADSPWGGGYTEASDSIHGNKSCFGVGCHATLVDVKLNDALLTTCGGCHPGDFHHDDAHYGGEDSGCGHCHSQGTDNGKKNCLEACHRRHLPTFDHHVDLADSNDNSYYGASCNDGCHADNNVGPFGAAGNEYKCSYCHAPEENTDLHHLLADVSDGCNDGCHAVNNVGPFGVVNGANACAVCHSEPAIDLHHALDGADEVASCNACHYDVAAENNKAIKHGDVTDGNRGVTCADCHVIQSTVLGNSLKDATGVSYVKSTLPQYEGREAAAVADTTPGTVDSRANRQSMKLWTEKTWEGDLAPVALDGTAKDYAEGEWMVCFKCHAGEGVSKGPWNNAGNRYGTWNGSIQPNVGIINPIASQGSPATGSTNVWFATDLAREFNPNNPSGHRVVANPDGTVAGWGFTRGFAAPNTTYNPTDIDKRLSNQAGTLQTMVINTAPYNDATYGWLYFEGMNLGVTGANRLDEASLKAAGARFDLNEQSVLKCTDCHSGDMTAAKGPHGATTTYMLDSRWNKRDWKRVVPNSQHQITGNNAYICAKCHFMGSATAQNATANLTAPSRGMGSTHFRVWMQNETGHWNAWGCGACHTAIPHGWKRPRLLVSTDDDYGTPYLAENVIAGNDSRTSTNNRGGWRRMNATMNRTNFAASWSTAPTNANYAACSNLCGRHGAQPTNYLP